MCGRYSLSASGEKLAEQFQLAEIPELAPRYNIAPTQEVAVVRQCAEGRQLALLRWGLIPSWAKDPRSGARMINARAETVAEKPAFRSAFVRRRCLVPADGFYEWKRTAGGKQPFFFQMRDGRPLAFAGLWEQWKSPDGGQIESYTILTTDANELLRPVHDRMPVILPPAAYDLWLDPDVQKPDVLLALLHPYPEEAMTAYPVSMRVNSPANDDPQCIAPIA